MEKFSQPMQMIDLVFILKKKSALILLISLVFLLNGCASIENFLPGTEILSDFLSEQSKPQATTTLSLDSTPSSPQSPPALPVDNPDNNFSFKVSPTPIPVSTATPTLTPCPDPVSSSDLLYIEQEKLMRWDYVTQYASLLADRVIAYAAVADEYASYQLPETVEKAVKKKPTKLVLLRSQEITANGAELFDLEILDLESKQITSLVEKIPLIESLQLTKLGDRLAYIQRGDNDQIFMLDLSGQNKPQHIADCVKENDETCNSFLWSPDGRYLAWSDPRGIWLAQVEDLSVQLVQPDIITVKDPRGQESKSRVDYELHSWSPAGRFILVKLIPSAEGVQWYSLLDTRLARLVNIPESADYSNRSSKITWTYDGDLLVAHASLPEFQQAPYLQFWQIIPTNNTLLSAGKKLELNHSCITDNQANLTEVQLCPIYFQQLDPITYRLAILNPQGTGSAKLYQLNIEKNILEIILPIPATTQSVLWSPDTNGALILGENNQVAFASFIHNQLMDLTMITGKEAHSFQWLYPSPRQ